MAIVSRPATKEYRDNWPFGDKAEKQSEESTPGLWGFAAYTIPKGTEAMFYLVGSQEDARAAAETTLDSLDGHVIEVKVLKCDMFKWGKALDQWIASRFRR